MQIEHEPRYLVNFVIPILYEFIVQDALFHDVRLSSYNMI